MTLRRFCLAGSLVWLGLVSGAAHHLMAAGLAWNAAAPLMQEVPIQETYSRQCAACHGEHGRGDGRMARRFKPPPADFQHPDGVSKRTDQELIEVITSGRTSMPAFGDVLSEEVIAVLVAYVRELGHGTDR